jgi:hypothetical protein
VFVSGRADVDETRVQSLGQVVEANTHLRLSKLRQSNSKKAAKAGVKTRAKKKLVRPTAHALTAHARPHTRTRCTGLG